MNLKMTLFEELGMKEKIENEVESYLGSRDLIISKAAFNVTYFMQEQKLKESIINSLFNECKELFGDIVRLLNTDKIYIDMSTKIRVRDTVRVVYYSLYIDISCYNNLSFSVRDCTTIPFTDIEISNCDDEYIKNSLIDKVSDEYIDGLIKISHIVKNYNNIFIIYNKIS